MLQDVRRQRTTSKMVVVGIGGNDFDFADA